MKMKLFQSSASDIEKNINDWLEENSEVKVIELRQSWNYSFWGSSFVVISIWYET